MRAPGTVSSGVANTSARGRVGSRRFLVQRPPGREPDECVSRWRTVTRSLFRPVHPGGSAAPARRDRTRPCSTSCITAVVMPTTLVSDCEVPDRVLVGPARRAPSRAGRRRTARAAARVPTMAIAPGNALSATRAIEHARERTTHRVGATRWLMTADAAAPCSSSGRRRARCRRRARRHDDGERRPDEHSRRSTMHGHAGMRWGRSVALVAAAGGFGSGARRQKRHRTRPARLRVSRTPVRPRARAPGHQRAAHRQHPAIIIRGRRVGLLTNQTGIDENGGPRHPAGTAQLRCAASVWRCYHPPLLA